MFSSHEELTPERIPQSSRKNACLELISLTSLPVLTKSLFSTLELNAHGFNRRFREGRLSATCDSSPLLPTSTLLSQRGNKKPQWVSSCCPFSLTPKCKAYRTPCKVQRPPHASCYAFSTSQLLNNSKCQLWVTSSCSHKCAKPASESPGCSSFTANLQQNLQLQILSF